jgi:hypothetical protein
MSTPSHQTVRLSKGKHSSPDNGACVMELASMLAGEPFSDHPVSVCPVIGAFLRTYNDSIDTERRQDLYAYAAKVVGSRGSEQLQRARAERLNAWISERKPLRWTRFLLPAFLPALADMQPNDVLGVRAVRAIRRHDGQTHAEVLALIDELLALRTGDRALPTTTAPGASASPPTVSGRQ